MTDRIMQGTRDHREGPRSEKKAYAPPSLEVFGFIEELATGTGTMNADAVSGRMLT